MQKSIWNSIILLCTIALFLWSIIFALYNRDNNSIQNKEYSSDCEYTSTNDIFIINAICIQQKKLPQLTLVNIIDRVRDQIESFSGYYEPFSTSFNYYWATPKFKTKWNPYLQWNEKSDQLISEAIKWRKKIKITYDELAQYYAEHLSYFVADKDLTNLWKCSRKNYTIAMETLDNYVMNPWDIFNVNQKLSWIKNYCKWKTEEKYLFYGWVCGMVSQLFRVSLINPNITINKRFSHNERFVQYYWKDIGWDDAAIYERSKQFEIENNSNSDIIFKVREKWDNTILVAISRPINERVNISKNSIKWRKTAIHLEKTVYQTTKSENSNSIKRIESFDSYYTKKNYEFR